MTNFKVGDRVRVDTEAYCGDEVNKGTGTVTRTDIVRRRGSIEVEIDDHGMALSYHESELTRITGVKLEEGKTYVTIDGKKYGPMTRRDSIVFPWQGESGSGEYDTFTDSGAYWAFQSSAKDLVAEHVVAEAAATAFKIGDRVRVVKHVNRFGNSISMDLPVRSEHTIVRFSDAVADNSAFILSGSDRHFYTAANLELVEANDAVPATPAKPKVGDWVSTEDGDIGIVFYDDGTGANNLMVAYTDQSASPGTWEYFNAEDLEVVPAGTVKTKTAAAANDNYQIHDIVEIADDGYFGLDVKVGDLATVTGFDADGDLRLRVNTTRGPLDQYARRDKGDVRPYRRAA